jgi:hypothetical protein
MFENLKSRNYCGAKKVRSGWHVTVAFDLCGGGLAG